MEPQNPHHRPRPPHPHFQTALPPPPSQIPPRTASSTPASSPGLFSPSNPRSNMSLPAQTVSEGTTPAASNSPYLHPLQSHKVRETHKANVDTDFTTGRKLINHYEIIDELGRGMHGKVKLARDLETGENVAIKIVPRFSKRRRLGKVTAMSTQDKSKKEIAILKKIRHPNVVALLEIIDDPELKKIYMVLEHVELGEIVWRKKGVPHISVYERRRVEREMRGEEPSAEEEMYERVLERRQAIKVMKRARMSQTQRGTGDYWSLEYAASEDDDIESQSRSLPRTGSDLVSRSFTSMTGSLGASRATSRAPSRNQSLKSLSRSGTPHPSEPECSASNEDDLETPVPAPTGQSTTAALDGTMYGAYVEDPSLRGRSPSMADSIISHMSSVDFNRVHDPFADDFSYVPCFTQEQARGTFRDTVLGLEYLHYEGVVHRDIKPANLLWTREHRVKISDFGVSYFGRPIRDGEVDESISESEAKDFDNDLELAKTVGTPAFFAPELCYTEPFDSKGRPTVQPKVSEQIDVWSLGVTLYCLIFARIPFLAEDEWQMFRKIASEDVFIPTRRLRPVDPATKPNERSLYHRVNPFPYRNDDELAYEDVDSELIDLLMKMLRKNPAERIRLRDVKRHPWVTEGISNPLAWIDDTDPSRFTAGRRIQVDDKEMAHAVVPISILERAKSAMKRAVGKVIPHRTDRVENASRRRATSSAASSGVDITAPASGNATPHPSDGRRRSLRPDDYFTNLYSQASSAPSEHPLSQSVTASPDHTPDEKLPESATRDWTTTVGVQSTARPAKISDFNAVEEADHQPGTSTQRAGPRHWHARSVTNAFLTLTPTLRESSTVPPAMRESSTVPPTPSFGDPADDPSNALRKARDVRPTSEDGSRARSVDRGLFSSSDKRAEAKVSLSTAMAPGNVSIPQRAPTGSDRIKGLEANSLPSPLAAAFPRSLTGYQHGQPNSDPNMQDRKHVLSDLESRPQTAHRIHDLPDAKTPPPRVYNSSTPESFARAQEQMLRRQAREHEEHLKRQQVMRAAAPAGSESDGAGRAACPPSPDDEKMFMPKPVLFPREGIVATAVSSNSSVGGMTTPLTSPSLTTDAMSTSNLVPMAAETSDRIIAFQSDPSLPALLSGASSVSADPEGDFLSSPGVVTKPSVIDTTDSLTPPALAKEPVAGFPLEHEDQVDQGVVTVGLDDDGIGHTPVSIQSSIVNSHKHDDEADDSDSDDGITMARSKKKAPSRDSLGRAIGGARRRNTNISIGSTDTAKKLIVDDD